MQPPDAYRHAPFRLMGLIAGLPLSSDGSFLA